MSQLRRSGQWVFACANDECDYVGALQPGVGDHRRQLIDLTVGGDAEEVDSDGVEPDTGRQSDNVERRDRPAEHR